LGHIVAAGAKDWGVVEDGGKLPYFFGGRGGDVGRGERRKEASGGRPDEILVGKKKNSPSPEFYPKKRKDY